ncbi:hypothetical protein BT63DRAFT_452002 [Microthyrium microscopicum]|uniref:Uncharacterized protein n=1 Tax=Microthyrium microscopicum TaxID=703497 RepID=A0A6A6UQD3_9PEZI|nr:hypothetical protein BT63DRAFT_452002 [Microthyrium microscopicum]
MSATSVNIPTACSGDIASCSTCEPWLKAVFILTCIVLGLATLFAISTTLWLIYLIIRNCRRRRTKKLLLNDREAARPPRPPRPSAAAERLSFACVGENVSSHKDDSIELTSFPCVPPISHPLNTSPLPPARPFRRMTPNFFGSSQQRRHVSRGPTFLGGDESQRIGMAVPLDARSSHYPEDEIDHVDGRESGNTQRSVETTKTDDTLVSDRLGRSTISVQAI